MQLAGISIPRLHASTTPCSGHFHHWGFGLVFPFVRLGLRLSSWMLIQEQANTKGQLSWHLPYSFSQCSVKPEVLGINLILFLKQNQMY